MHSDLCLCIGPPKILDGDVASLYKAVSNILCMLLLRKKIDRQIEMSDTDELARILQDVPTNAKHLVILDGFAHYWQGDISRISDVCHVWLWNKLDHH